MGLTQVQILEIIREQASSPSGFNHLVELLLDNLMHHERSLYLSSHEGISVMASAHFAYLAYPPKVQRMIYTTNWTERLNSEYKRVLNMRGAMPRQSARPSP